MDVIGPGGRDDHGQQVKWHCDVRHSPAILWLQNAGSLEVLTATRASLGETVIRSISPTTVRVPRRLWRDPKTPEWAIAIELDQARPGDLVHIVRANTPCAKSATASRAGVAPDAASVATRARRPTRLCAPDDRRSSAPDIGHSASKRTCRSSWSMSSAQQLVRVALRHAVPFRVSAQARARDAIETRRHEAPQPVRRLFVIGKVAIDSSNQRLRVLGAPGKRRHPADAMQPSPEDARNQSRCSKEQGATTAS